jgi:hypothetical protein
VPKERFISYPGCESDHDGEPVYGWAGWDHEQRARALATLYVNRRDEESWSTERLTPMLAGLLELLPWLKQWHGAASDDYAGVSPAAYYEGFLDEECRKLGLTHENLRAWRPAEKTRGKKAGAAPEPKPSKGDWLVLVSPESAPSIAVAAAVVAAGGVLERWRAECAARLALSGKVALTVLDGEDAKLWKRRIGDDAKADIDADAVLASVERAVEAWKSTRMTEDSNGRLTTTLTRDEVRPDELFERVRFVVDHALPKIATAANVASLFSAATKASHAKRRAVSSGTV